MVIPGREKLSGDVEIDETFVGGEKPGKRGRGAEGKDLVVIAVEVKEYGLGRVRLGVIPDASHKSLKKFTQANVEVGSNIMTDGWKAYIKMKALGYRHTVISRKTADDPENFTPNVHLVASLLKRWLLGTHQNFVQKSHLEYYLDEFTFRHNRRKSKSRGLLFETILKQAVSHKPILRAELKGK
jgi:transposase-like protein